MKILPILLINAVMVGGGIVIYDQLQDDAPAPTYQESSGLTDDVLARLDERYLGQDSGGEPLLQATGTDPRLLARLDALEKRLAMRAAPSKSAPAEETAEDSNSPLARPEVAMDGVEPSDEEVERFRKIQQRADELRRAEQERERLTRFLDRIEVDLTEEEQDKLLATQRSYRRKFGEKMREIWQSGDDREVMRESMRTLGETMREEVSVEIQEYLSVGDAQKITENLNQLVRGFGGRGGRGGPPGRGGR